MAGKSLTVSNNANSWMDSKKLLTNTAIPNMLPFIETEHTNFR